MRVFDDILDTLSDGKYHNFDELTMFSSSHNEDQIELIMKFLESYGFIRRQRKVWSTRTNKVRLEPSMLNFLRRLKELEDQEKKECKIGIEQEANKEAPQQ